MGNKTIYVKDEALWEKAKQFAGKEGLSGVIAEALAEFVQKKEREAERRGLALHEISFLEDDGTETLKFYGKEVLANLALPFDDKYSASLADLYLTRADKWLVILKDATTYEPYRYKEYDTPEELARSGVLKSNPTRVEFPPDVAGPNEWYVWID